VTDSSAGVSLSFGAAAQVERLRRREEWLLAPSSAIPLAEVVIEQRVAASSEVIQAKERLREDAIAVYQDPRGAVERLVASTEKAKSVSVLQAEILARPQEWGLIQGGTGWFGRPSHERREALEVVPRLALDVVLLARAEQSARRDVLRREREEDRRASIGIPAPSEELERALAQPGPGSAIVERPELVQELRRIERAFNERLRPDDRAELRAGHMARVAREYAISEDRAFELQRVAAAVAATVSAAAKLEHARRQGVVFGQAVER